MNISPVNHRLDVWLTAIREALIALMPLTFLGVAAVVLSQPLPTSSPLWLAELRPQGLQHQAALLLNVTLGCLGLASAHQVAYRAFSELNLSRSSNAPSPSAVGAIAAVGFLLLVTQGAMPTFQSLGYQNVFQGIFSAVITVEAIVFLHRMTNSSSGLIALDAGTSMHRALRLTWMSAVTLLLLLTIKHLSTDFFAITHPAFIAAVQYLFHLAESSPWMANALLIVTNQLIWVFGINGGQFIHALSSTVDLPIADSSVLWSNQEATPMFLNAFAHLGGAGATFGLILATLFFVKDKSLRRLAALSLVPALLNVNELLLFGVPLILNRLMVFPFVVAPLASAGIALAAISTGMISLTGVPVSWSTPAFVSGYLMTDSLIGAAVQGLSVAVATAIYLPFIRRLERQRAESLTQTLKTSIVTLAKPDVESAHIIDRADNLGEVARRLLIDFQDDLEHNRLVLAYQPQLDRNRVLVGVEALLRWHHPRYGLIPPDAIVNVAEESSVIHDLGFWVTRQACSDLAEWKANGFVGFKVSINISALQLEDPRFAVNMQAILESFGIAPGEIELEITERRPLRSSEITEKNLRQLLANGFHLSMDDFGMGATSLLLMQRFKLRSIKLDKCLTQGIEKHPVNQEIIKSVTRLARVQGVKTIAEHVETETQKDMLLSLGCDVFQGWLYSRAVSAAELLEFIESAAGEIHWPMLPVDSIDDSEPSSFFHTAPPNVPLPVLQEVS